MFAPTTPWTAPWVEEWSKDKLVGEWWSGGVSAHVFDKTEDVGDYFRLIRDEERIIERQLKWEEADDIRCLQGEDTEPLGSFVMERLVEEAPVGDDFRLAVEAFPSGYTGIVLSSRIENQIHDFSNLMARAQMATAVVRDWGREVDAQWLHEADLRRRMSEVADEVAFEYDFTHFADALWRARPEHIQRGYRRLAICLNADDYRRHVIRMARLMVAACDESMFERTIAGCCDRYWCRIMY